MCISLVLLAITPYFVFSDEASQGQAAFSTIEIGFGARNASMGNAAAGLSDDINTIWWNPAGLGQLQLGEASLSYHSWFQGWKDSYGSVGYNTPKGYVAAGFIYSDVSGMEIRTRQDQPIPGTYKTYESIFSLGYGNRWKKNLYYGATLLGFYVNLNDDIGKAVATNLGVLWKYNRNGVGICVQNLGTTVEYYYKSSDYLPRTLRIGANISPVDKMNTLFEIAIPQFGEENVGIGLEYWLNDMIALRGGYRTIGSEGGKYFEVIDKISMGFGIKYKNIGFDYAYANCWDLGMVHRITLGYVFGSPAKTRTGNIIVKVIDSETKKPLQSIVIISGTVSDTVLTSGKTGTRTMENVPIGQVIIRAEKDFFTPKEDTLTLGWYDTKKLEIALKYTGPKDVPHERAVKGIFGKVTGSDTKLPVNATITYKGPENGSVTTDSSGWYAVDNLLPGDYTLNIESNSHNYFPQVIENVTVQKGKATLTHCDLTKVKIMRLYFERDRAYVHPNDYPVLDNMASFVQKYRENTFEINGHTDPRPTTKFKSNKELSYARANSVKEYLISKGIPSYRLSVKGFGSDQPIASNDTEEGMAFNRRIEIVMNPPTTPLTPTQTTPDSLKTKSNTSKSTKTKSVQNSDSLKTKPQVLDSTKTNNIQTLDSLKAIPGPDSISTKKGKKVSKKK
ncbi:MAG: PorV/PorQ family protein [bacterium]|nr:PorV/PorQ family protein [bacterium]